MDGNAGRTLCSYVHAIQEAIDDTLASLVLKGYEIPNRSVRVSPSTASRDTSRFSVRSCEGSTIESQPRTDQEARGSVQVAWRPGNDWAQGMRLTWVTVGAAPGLCPAEQGFLALVSDTADRANLLALAPWEGSCVTEEHSVRFMTAAGQHLILEADGDAGEDSFTERWDRVWLLAQTRLQAAGRIRRALEDTRAPWTVPGFKRRMTASLEATSAGLVVRELWHFTPLSPTRTSFYQRRERLLRLEAGHVVSPEQPDPMPGPGT